MARDVKLEKPGESAATEEAGTKAKSAPAPAATVKRAEDVDPALIPFGQTVLTDKGYVCSTALDPRGLQHR